MFKPRLGSHMTGRCPKDRHTAAEALFWVSVTKANTLPVQVLLPLWDRGAHGVRIVTHRCPQGPKHSRGMSSGAWTVAG